MRRTLRQVLPLACVLVPFLAAGAQDSQAILNRLQAIYNADTSLMAEFYLVANSDYWDTPQQQRGRLQLSGQRYRIETESDVLVVADDVSTLYRREENQVIITSLEGGNDILSLGSALGDIGSRFEVVGADEAALGGAMHDVIRLSPRSDYESIRDLSLWLRRQDGLVTRIESQDGTVHVAITFDNIELDARIDAGAFGFVPPVDAEVIDMRF